MRSSGCTRLFPARRDAVAAAAHERVAFRRMQVGLHHLGDELLEADARLPSQLAARARRIAKERVDLGRPEVARIDRDDAPAPRIEPGLVLALAAPAHAQAELG